MTRFTRIITLLLCICLLAGMLSVAGFSSGSGLGFISINDTLPPELVGAVYNYGGLTYVPYWLFTSYGLGISYTFFSDISTVYLSRGGQELFFDMNNGNALDGDGYYYTARAVLRGGTVYLPIAFVARFFGGFNYNFITGSPYGSILRIKTGSEVLTDAEFLRAAESAMRTHYNNYSGDQSSVLFPDGDGSGGNDREGITVSLSFIGLPDDEILSALSKSEVKACFFLTADDVRTSPGTVRRIAGEGHSLGVYCRSDLINEYAEASALIFEAARVKTLLVCAQDEYAETCRQTADMQSLVYCPCDIDAVYNEGERYSEYSVTARLNILTQGSFSLFMDCVSAHETLRPLLIYLDVNRCNTPLLREIN